MTNVLGISGVFLFANDPKSLQQWYRDRLGLDLACWGEDSCYGIDLPHTLPDGQESHTVFSIQKAKEPLSGPRRETMVNWRVADLEALLADLAAAGIPVEKREDSEYGRFAWIRDPEGNRLELYQKPA